MYYSPSLNRTAVSVIRTPRFHTLFGAQRVYKLLRHTSNHRTRNREPAPDMIRWPSIITLYTLYSTCVILYGCCEYGPLVSMGQDGHLRCALDSLGFPQHVHYFPWYSGIGWTLGIWEVVHGTAWDSHSVSITSHGTVGWDGMDIVGIPSVCPF